MLNTLVQLIPLPKEVIDQCFEEAEHQSDYALALFKIALPVDWEKIAEIKGHPKVSRACNKYIFEKAITFDQKHHPRVLNGGLWLNKGFSSSDDVEMWTVSLEGVEIVWVDHDDLA